MISNEIFIECKRIDFPQTYITEASVKRNFNNLKYSNQKPQSNCCVNIIQMFHPSLWKANRKGFISPYEAWYNDGCIQKAIENRLKYKGKNISPIDIRAAFSTARIAPKVSIFRPAMAKYLIAKYLDDVAEIFDPCSGYSGRLLGAAALNKSYIGQDINPITIQESGALIQKLELSNITLSCKNSISTEGVYESLFTCPPYLDKENWNQSIEELSCDEWIDICLNNYQCKTYIFVVDHTTKYQKYIVEKIQNKSHFGVNSEYVIKIGS